MSFGLRDEDWVDPDDPIPIKCRDCEYWQPCPCGCGYGWCADRACDFTEEDDGCE